MFFSLQNISSRHVLGPTFLLRHALADRGGLRQGLWADQHCLHLRLACWPWRHDGLWNVTIINANHFLFIFFSSAMRRAWHEIYPDHNIRGCLFHFAQVRLFQCSLLRKSLLELVEMGQYPWILKRLQWQDPSWTPPSTRQLYWARKNTLLKYSFLVVSY